MKGQIGSDAMNLKIRSKNLLLIVQIVVGAVLMLMSHYSITPDSLTTWGSVGHTLMALVKNPVAIVTFIWYIWAAINDPTTSGASDSDRAKSYTELG